MGVGVFMYTSMCAGTCTHAHVLVVCRDQELMSGIVPSQSLPCMLLKISCQRDFFFSVHMMGVGVFMYMSMCAGTCTYAHVLVVSGVDVRYRPQSVSTLYVVEDLLSKPSSLIQLF